MTEFHEELQRVLDSPKLAAVKNPDRVEALPIEYMSEVDYQIRESPVTLDPKRAIPLGESLVSADSYEDVLVPCLFQPSLALRFIKDESKVQVIVCFICSELRLQGPDDWEPDRLYFNETVRAGLVAAAKEAFPRNEYFRGLR